MRCGVDRGERNGLVRSGRFGTAGTVRWAPVRQVGLGELGWGSAWLALVRQARYGVVGCDEVRYGFVF